MENLEVQIQIFEAKRAEHFSRLQTIYQLIPNLNNDEIRDTFLAQARCVQQIREEFIEAADQINILNLQIKPGFPISYKSLTAFDDLYYIVKGQLQKLERESTKPSIQVPYKEHIKIPRIELPTFDGEIQNFPFFYETFKRVIHLNANLTDSERIHYLIGHLTGKAKSIAVGLVPSAENYIVLWDTLIAKYHDTRALATNYLNDLFTLKSNNAHPLQLEVTIDKFTSLVAGLQQLKLENLSEFMFIYMGLKLLDVDTARSFEMSIRGEKMPNYNDFIKFVRDQIKILQRTSQRVGKPITNNIKSRGPQAYLSSSKECQLCHTSHDNLYYCKIFYKFSPNEKLKYVTDNNICNNCLSERHTLDDCLSKTMCKKCNEKHHTLLHHQSTFTATASAPEHNGFDDTEPDISDVEEPLCTVSSSLVATSRTTEVLATAQVLAFDNKGKNIVIRCLLDPGSQKHYITVRCCRRLGLPIVKNPIHAVKGIGGTSQIVSGSVTLTVSSKFQPQLRYKIEALVLDRITSQLPVCSIDMSTLNYLKGLSLADESWGVPGDIDVLFGVTLFSRLLLKNKIMSSMDTPDALETTLGYILMGNAPTICSKVDSWSFSATSCVDCWDLRKFWEQEEITCSPITSIDDKYCEEFYKDSVSRHTSGKYTVALPLKMSATSLGDSYKLASRRFFALERKFKDQPAVKRLYDDVIKEYLEKSYITPVIHTHTATPAFFIPHHPVIREDKTTTKLRIVLDASARSDNGISLNDILYTGPSLQADLFTILINMRLFKIALIADIKQMYLRIEVKEEDRSLQQILYRFSPNEPLQTYQFNCVTFGLICSPFLAIRTIQQLCHDEGKKFPIANQILSRDIYMDDIVSSVIDTDEALAASQQLIKMFATADFELAKWSSNNKEVLQTIPESLQISQCVDLDMNSNLKILGLRWNPEKDHFEFQVIPDTRPCTKRNILSSIARLFDVLGLVAPIILYAKLIIKELWLEKIGWDDVPSRCVVDRWERYNSELPLIATIKFPRHIGVGYGSSFTIVGFADASEKAYGGVVYSYVETQKGNIVVTLLCAKSRVSPLKIVSLARLELCAALLLSNLIKKIINIYSTRHKIQSVFAFSDSTVALSWINSAPHRWNTYVANRIVKIQENVSPQNFFHIKGSENPSDCLSRGLTPVQLIGHRLWLQGPSWLNLPQAHWPVKPFIITDSSNIPEAKSNLFASTCGFVSSITNGTLHDLSTRFSSWIKFLHITCYIFKFLKRLPKGPISATDLNFAEVKILQSLQQFHFSTEISALQNNKSCSKQILRLNPFIHEGILRVGGRLAHSHLSFESKHPILLPQRDHIVNLIITSYHEANFHTGPNLVLSLLRQRYWILAARRIVRHLIHKCNLCFKYKPKPTYPVMADLPSVRVNSSVKAFSEVGCDFAGPLLYIPYRKRGIKCVKAYICLFTCLTTRAVHIELATELSSACFLNALRRFLSRRGPVRCVYSDHGTNFIGAKSYLRELYRFFSKEYQPYWEAELAKNRINWKLIPPNAPHFGGCWESTVKCVKTHLIRMVGQQSLTYEELDTILTQIEALLNSRPLYALSTDPSEPTALTPAHFLNTSPLTFLPSHEITESRLHILNRYQLLDKIIQSFWKRWRNEYLHTLQIRQKWNTKSNPIQIGMIVVLMQDNVMPLHWPLGIIVNTFPGRDGIVRVASVKTKSGILQRPVVKLCPLPTQ